MLAGEPALEKLLRDPRLQKLRKRIQRFAKLDTLDRKESIAYIQRKLAAASPAGAKVFSSAAIRKIAKASNGIPRSLNMICTDALVAGCRRRKKPISVNIVEQVLTEYQIRRPRRASRRLWLGAIVLFILVGVVAVTVSQKAWFNHLQVAATWPQQAIDRVQPIIVNLTQKAKALVPQVPAAVDPPVASPVASRAEPAPVRKIIAPRETAVAAAPPLDLSKPEVMPAKPEVMSAKPGVMSAKPENTRMQRVASLIDQHFPSGGAFRLKVWGNKVSDEAYAEGERLVLHVMAESPAFLRIDYYQADGKIVHLLPNPLMSNRVEASQQFTLGGDGHAFQFKVAPPFGTEMLTVVASRQPIEIGTETSTEELNDSYVDRLSRRLQTYGSQGKTAATYLRIQTQP